MRLTFALALAAVIPQQKYINKHVDAARFIKAFKSYLGCASINNTKRVAGR